MKKIFTEYAIRHQELTFDSAAGLTFPFTENAPPRTTICPIFFGNEGSSSRAWGNGQMGDRHFHQNFRSKRYSGEKKKRVEAIQSADVSSIVVREQREADQSKVGERAEGDDGDLSRVQIRLLDEEGSYRLLHWLGCGRRSGVLVSQAV